MVTRKDVKRLVGQTVTLRLTPQAPGGPTVTGKLVGVLEAADGLVVTLEPAGVPGARVTYHYHYILAVEPGTTGG
ncbi:MAG: hypothetical protein QN174_11705 [Armatimonadota bacterium]|nr:hypothetical protein [Armatimonadota bacterium]MDR7422716.1 hypothetical protein [Armatimonadota bacterium]MDR7454030.1 hypothetical protein [Armatimonadota bacterium]MDR7457428.1 hypothetical protein [Armatimonadota bacterium]MDR7497608.1 hypothetical protein [Armatimonadota bacterium]